MKKHKPRILYIATFPPPVHGSAMVSLQIKESKVINEAFDGDFVNLGTSRKMEEIGKGGVGLNLKKLCRFAGAFLKTLSLLLTHRYALCYCAITCHGSGFLKDAPFVLLCKLFGKKIVIHQHNKGMANDVDRPIYKWLLPLVYRNAKVILLSWHLYPDIERVVKKENVLICPNGIKPTVTPDFKREPNKVPHILFLSNLLIDKGVLVLLDALKILKDKGYSFVCDFVGSETKDIDAERFAKEVELRGLNRCTIYHGRKYGKDKEVYFEKADIFTFPSFYSNETFGLVNLEAMEHKLPVVSTNEGGIPDVVKDGENGLISEKRNSNSLAQCIAQLLESKELREKMGEDSYKKFKEHFTQQAFEDNFASCITEITQSGGVIFNQVSYHGKKYGKDKDAFFRNADIFAFPTSYSNECFPLVLLEAMNYKLPLVSTNVGGIPDEVKQKINGLLIDPNNPSACADAICELLGDASLRLKMGEESYRRFRESFTESIFEKTMITILKNEILGGVIFTSVNYWGRKYGKEKETFWRSADIFVSPSLDEAFPLVNLEAMSYKLPIVSTNVGGIPDEVEDKINGFVIAPNSPSACAEAIGKLLIDASLRKNMGEESYCRFKAHFTESVFEKTLTAILKNV